jgi:hypothetical protein
MILSFRSQTMQALTDETNALGSQINKLLRVQKLKGNSIYTQWRTDWAATRFTRTGGQIGLGTQN